ncbi:cAMP-dependent protein kinase inhibitor gamma [Tiliqua scincoides]|uniref:cAMP-dependent protein kinase inhibitor gamma n=1 Tax=Tiliqua scincoides TaxID=71010 RepID=UPI00346273E1
MDEPAFSDFISCHRTGRRNAVHDLQGDATRLNLEKLAGTMDEISIAEGESQGEADATEKEPGMTPKSQDGSPSL